MTSNNSIVPTIWGWKFESSWVGYNIEICRAIEEAYQEGNNLFQLKLNNWNYLLNFSDMIQINKLSHTKRPIKRCLDSYTFWLYESNYNTLCRFEPEVELKLEEIHLKFQELGHFCEYLWIDVKSHELLADVKTMEFTNLNTKVTRRMVRHLVETTVSKKLNTVSKNFRDYESIKDNRTCLSNSKISELSLTKKSQSHSLHKPDKVSSSNFLSGLNHVPFFQFLNFTKLGFNKNKNNKIALEILKDCKITNEEIKFILEEGILHYSGVNESIREDRKNDYMINVGPQDDECPICLDKLTMGAVKLSKCTHIFHINCLNEYMKQGQKGGLICPTCNSIEYLSNGPSPKGSMLWTIISGTLLNGYTNQGTIIIRYVIPKGIQSIRHTNPNCPFSGTIRHAYLPYNEQGKILFKLLKQAFEGGHTFTVGTSLSTGRADVVIWNGIHHKTNRSGGATFYGYPDTTYMDRTFEELKVKGIVACENELKKAIQLDNNS